MDKIWIRLGTASTAPNLEKEFRYTDVQLIDVDGQCSDRNRRIATMLRGLDEKACSKILVTGVQGLESVVDCLGACYLAVEPSGHIQIVVDSSLGATLEAWVSRLKSAGRFKVYSNTRPVRRTSDISHDGIELEARENGYVLTVTRPDRHSIDLLTSCSPKIGIAITSYSNESTRADRFDVIERSLESVRETARPDVSVIVVVDGPVQDRHRILLQKFDREFEIIYKSVNGGMARAKNTCIRKLLGKSVDIGFLLDDDVVVQPGWVSRYVELITRLGIDHVAAFIPEHFYEKKEWKKRGVEVVELENMKVLKHTGHHGCLLSFTPGLIEKIGYFKVYEGKVGLSHWNFTHRALAKDKFGFALDLVDSPMLLKHIGQDENWKFGSIRQNDAAATSMAYKQSEVKKSRSRKINIYDTDYVACEE